MIIAVSRKNKVFIVTSAFLLFLWIFTAFRTLAHVRQRERIFLLLQCALVQAENDRAQNNPEIGLPDDFSDLSLLYLGLEEDEVYAMAYGKSTKAPRIIYSPSDGIS